MKMSVAAIVLFLAALLSAPVMISAAHAQGVQSAPIAAPTGPAAQSQALAPPPGMPAGAAGDVSGNFSIVSMFLRADIEVQAVMVLLLLASLWSWTIIFN